MSLVSSFFEELDKGGWTSEQAKTAYEKIKEDLSATEHSTALVLLKQLEIKEAPYKLAPSELLRMVPKGWLQDYLMLCQVSEAPDSFHFFSAIAILTHLMGRQMWFSLGALNVYPPMSVFLVSPAGVARRSTAIRTAMRIGSDSGVTSIQDTLTPEGLIEHLQEFPQTIVVADEASTLLSRSEYMGMMPQILCSLLDCPNVFERRLKKGHVIIMNPTVSALIGCAPEWIMTAMPKNAVEGGLFSRMLVVHEYRRKRLIPLPNKEVDNVAVTDMVKNLVQTARQAANEAKGSITYNPKAERLFENFYVRNDREAREADEKVSIYLVRKPEHLHRLVMGLIAAGGKQNEVTVEMLETGLAILKTIEERMSEAYKSTGMEKPGRDQSRILKLLERAGGRLSHVSLLQRVSDSMTSMDMQRTIENLLDQGLVRVAPMEGKKGWVRCYERIGWKIDQE